MRVTLSKHSFPLLQLFPTRKSKRDQGEPSHRRSELDRDNDIFTLFKSILIISSENFTRYKAAFYILYLEYFNNKNVYKCYRDCCEDFWLNFHNCPFIRGLDGGVVGVEFACCPKHSNKHPLGGSQSGVYRRLSLLTAAVGSNAHIISIKCLLTESKWLDVHPP